MTVRSVIAAAFAAVWFVACGGTTADLSPDSGASTGGSDEGTGGAAGTGEAAGSGTQSTGGTTATGGVAATGGSSTILACLGSSTNDSVCPANWKMAFDEFANSCDRGSPIGTHGCLVSDTNCGLQTAVLEPETGPGPSLERTYCFYDWVTEELVGITHFGKAYACRSLDATFPPDGFLRGECGPGSFDNRTAH